MVRPILRRTRIGSYAQCLARRVLVSATRRASVRVANIESVEPGKRVSRRVKSPKSKSPAPPIPVSASASTSLSTLENDDARDAVLQLKGHYAEVSEH